MRAWPLTASLVCTVAAHAQTPSHSLRIAAPLFDLVVLPDSTYGLHLLASPSLASVSGHKQTNIDHLALELDSLSAWIPAARTLLDSGALIATPGSQRAIGAKLSADRGQSSLTLGYDVSQPLDERFLLIVEDGVKRNSWRAPLPDSSARLLVTALIEAWTVSRLVPVNSTPGHSRARLVCEVDQPPVMIKAPTLRYPSVHPFREGRVWAQYVIDTTGRADLSSVQFVLSDGPSFEKEVLRGLKDIRFTPGRAQGAAVPTLGFQGFTFKALR